MLEGRRGGAAAQVCVRAEAVAPARPREGRGARGGGRGQGGRGQGRAGTEGESGGTPLLMQSWVNQIWPGQGIQRLNRTAVKPVQGLQFTNKPRFRSLLFT